MANDVLDFMSEMDSLFGKAAAKAAKPKAQKVKQSFPAKPAEPEYWQPVAVVLRTHQWQCKCGCSGFDRPGLYLEERFGQRTRYRAIGLANHYAGLPRRKELDEPSLLDICEHCFHVESDPFAPQQLQFAFPEDLAPFVQAVGHVLSREEKIERIREMRNGIDTSFDTSLYDDCTFPHLVQFERKNGKTSDYEFNVVDGDFGPELPHCRHFEE